MNAHAFGAIGEELAAAFLRRQGYKILARNYTCPLGEIDFIARDREVLVFVEVKARRSEAAGDPLESITRHKRGQVLRCAKYYMTRFGLHDRPCRFDAVSVKIAPDDRTQVEICRNAFGEGG